MPTRYVRFIANASMTVLFLLLIIVRLKSFPASPYHILWSGVAIIVLVLDIYFLTKSTFNKPQNVDTSLSSFALAIGGTMGFLASALVITYPFPQYPFTNALRQVGGVVALLPYPFIIWALFCLKSCFTIIPEAHGIVAHGIYKYSRHPLYMCYIVWAFANMMMFPSWPMIAVSLTHITVMILRLKREERLLLATFPEYGDYYNRTGLIGNIRLNFLLGKGNPVFNK